MPPLSVLLEDNHLLAVNKPAGILVQGDATGDEPMVDKCKAYIKEKYGKPGEVFLGVVHRIDRPVSGVVLFARTSKALARMNEQFRLRETQKIYWAITDVIPKDPEATLVHWLQKGEKKNRTTVFAGETSGALRSELAYRVLRSGSGLHLLEVRPLTGRPHQIRAQLAAIGCPIIGDIKYGSGYITGDKSIGLHARSLAFSHPVQKNPTLLEAPAPRTDWWAVFK